MEEFILPVEIVNSQNCLDLLAIIISVLIPILVMVITLFCSYLGQKRALKQQATEFNQSLREQKENTRLSIMPVFDVEAINGAIYSPPYLKTVQATNHLIEIRLKNVGNGSAISPCKDWIPANNNCMYGQIYESDSAYYRRYKSVEASTLIAQVDREITVILERVKKNVEDQAMDWLIFSIQFRDMLDNQYEQKIAINFCINGESGNVELLELQSNVPVLLKATDANERHSN